MKSNYLLATSIQVKIQIENNGLKILNFRNLLQERHLQTTNKNQN